MRSRTTRGLRWLVASAALGVSALVPATALAAPDSDLSITKTDSADPVAVGDEFTYTLTIANAGPQKAKDVVVGDQLPPEVDFVSVSTTQGGCANSGNTVACDLGFLDEG